MNLVSFFFVFKIRFAKRFEFKINLSTNSIKSNEIKRNKTNKKNLFRCQNGNRTPKVELKTSKIRFVFSRHKAHLLLRYIKNLFSILKMILRFKNLCPYLLKKCKKIVSKICFFFSFKKTFWFGPHKKTGPIQNTCDNLTMS